MSDTALAVRTSAPLPAVVLGAGERASIRFVEFFASNIRNVNTLRVEDVYVQNRLLWVREREKGGNRPTNARVPMATVGRWFATWIQDACSFDMSRTCHRAARHPKQPWAISSCATHTDQSMPSCYGLSERLSIPADVGDRPPRAS